MSGETNDGGPIFPKMAGWRPTGNMRMETTAEYDAGGMSLRDLFAGLALIGLTINSDRNNADDACVAYQIADAMLAERSKP